MTPGSMFGNAYRMQLTRLAPKSACSNASERRSDLLQTHVSTPITGISRICCGMCNEVIPLTDTSRFRYGGTRRPVSLNYSLQLFAEAFQDQCSWTFLTYTVVLTLPHRLWRVL